MAPTCPGLRKKLRKNVNDISGGSANENRTPARERGWIIPYDALIFRFPEAPSIESAVMPSPKKQPPPPTSAAPDGETARPLKPEGTAAAKAPVDARAATRHTKRVAETNRPTRSGTKRRPFPDSQSSAPRVPAWAMSLGLHVVIVLLLAVWIESRPRGTGDEGDRPIGIAVAHRMSDRTEYEQPSETAQTAENPTESNATSAAAAAAAAAAELAQPLDVDGLLADVTDTPLSGSSTGSQTAVGAGDGEGVTTKPSGNGDGPEATTMFFGVSGSGRRFVYVLDRSQSMKGTPLNAAKREIVRSLSSLTENQTFQVVIYNNRASFFQPQGSSFWMLPADEQMVRRAERYVRATEALGGTAHYDALRTALKFEPDVIFLLTDARIPQLGPSQLAEMRARCQRIGTTIHAIEFGRDLAAPEVSFLRNLAAENNGEYRYINVATLQ